MPIFTRHYAKTPGDGSNNLLSVGEKEMIKHTQAATALANRSTAILVSRDAIHELRRGNP
jgi:hypothetical protein